MISLGIPGCKASGLSIKPNFKPMILFLFSYGFFVQMKSSVDPNQLASKEALKPANLNIHYFQKRGIEQ